jgi:hypothetical protein
MGYSNNTNRPWYPKQGAFLGRTVDVCFDCDTSCTVRGKVIRDDAEEPGLLLIRLDDGWVVRSVECQYSLVACEPKMEGAE